MEIILNSDPVTASRQAANYIANFIRKNAHAVLGLATGSTPLLLYRELIRFHQEDGLSFSKCTAFNLDEYVGLSRDHEASYHHFMRKNLFSAIDLPAVRTHIPDGLATNIPAHCADYEKSIVAAGGIDLQILGIGSDGHIGFNEPASSLASRTRIKTLTERTRQDNSRFFNNPDDVPHHVITMGIGTLMEARCLLLLAFGESKADAVAAMVEGPITAMVPASILQMHPVVKVIIDEAAGSKLERLSYYRHVFDQKPDWQRW